MLIATLDIEISVTLLRNKLFLNLELMQYYGLEYSTIDI